MYDGLGIYIHYPVKYYQSKLMYVRRRINGSNSARDQIQ
jgi:hypothetical protein